MAEAMTTQHGDDGVRGNSLLESIRADRMEAERQIEHLKRAVELFRQLEAHMAPFAIEAKIIPLEVRQKMSEAQKERWKVRRATALKRST